MTPAFAPTLIKKNLQIMKQCISTRLTRSSNDVIKDVISQLTRIEPRVKKDSNYSWSVSIPEGTPIRFKECEKKAGGHLHVDFYGGIQSPSSKWLMNSYQIILRIWSSKLDWNYWPSLDFRGLKKRFIEDHDKRLLLVLRFEHTPPNGSMSLFKHPWFHMHVGAKMGSKSDPKSVAPSGCYRYPPNISPPRLSTFPMCYLLMARFAIANYHPKLYHELLKNKHWKGAIALTEKMMWSECCNEYSKHITSSGLKDVSFFDRTSMESQNGWPAK